ncbi:MAG: hypothetical protein IJV65_00975 [Kiritimatiellae bacterium]|nr:hypothetical protein [Kiritimatiellia bacterium]
MNDLDLLSALPPFRDWTPADVLASPAWAMPCRLGAEEGRLVCDGALLPADPLRLAVRFADDPATLALADSPLFPELHALWPARAEVPAPVLLALVEKECGPLLQLLENAAGAQLAVDGLADAGGAEHPASRPPRPFELRRASGDVLCSFALSLPPAVLASFGRLRNLDASHPSVRDASFPAQVQLAAPVLSEADLASVAPGDHVLLPEVDPGAGGGAPTCADAVRIVDGRLAATAAGVAPWSDPGTLRVVLAEPAAATFGELSALAAGGGAAAPFPLKAGAELALLRGGAVLASGRLDAVAGQASFAVESV